MSIIKKPTRAVILGGLFLVIPLVLILIIINHAIQILIPLGQKISDVLNIHSVFGAATLTVICVLLIIFLCYVAGMLIQIGLVRQWGKKMEQQLFLIVPSLQVLKYKLIDENRAGLEGAWKAILLKDGDFYLLAFITDEGDDKFMSVFIPDAPNMGGGEIRFVEKSSCEYQPISMHVAMSTLNSFGATGRPWEHIKKP
ncbi:hypothetical protein ABS768_06485 [Flavobacterium sp. ST-75]|uniref:DUF502 domain-containing protein n=1 Tax=Flavobacterium rhizophilum TaxID=3163296 RepID=A0ABW8YBI6_9FLAO